MRNKKHGCLYYLFIFPFLIPFYLIKWCVTIGGKITIWIFCIVAIALLLCVSIYVSVPIILILLIFGLFYRNRFKNIPDFDHMSGIEFEDFCCHLLSENGFSNIKTTKASGDQGIDILAQKDNLKYGIQCKCYSSNVGNSAIQEVFSGIRYYGCDKGIVLTNQFFTRSAIDLAQSTGIIMWDRNKLFNLIRIAYQSTSSENVSSEYNVLNRKNSEKLVEIGEIYSNAIKQFRYSDVALLDSRQTEFGYEFVYEAESSEQMDYIFTLEEDLNKNLEGTHIFKKLYDTRFLLKVIKDNLDDIPTSEDADAADPAPAPQYKNVVPTSFSKGETYSFWTIMVLFIIFVVIVICMVIYRTFINPI